MEIEYGKAPMHYIDGVPAYKAGEWPGLKSCKFRSYKRVIRPKEQGIFFNGKKLKLIARKRSTYCSKKKIIRARTLQGASLQNKR